MDVELLEIRQHMGRFPPFDGLSDDLLDAIAEQVEVSYFKTGSSILALNEMLNDLCYIRSGAVEVYRSQGELYTAWVRAIFLVTLACCVTIKCVFPLRRLKIP